MQSLNTFRNSIQGNANLNAPQPTKNSELIEAIIKIYDSHQTACQAAAATKRPGLVRQQGSRDVEPLSNEMPRITYD